MARPQRVLHEIEACRAADIAFQILAGDFLRIVEEALQLVDQIDIVLRVEIAGPIGRWGEIVLQLLPRIEDVDEVDRAADIGDLIVDVLVHRDRVGLDVGGEDAHRRVEDALGEVVDREREIGGREVDVDALLGRDLKRDALFGRVLDVERLAGADRILVRQPNLQAVAGLGAGYGEGVVILPVDRPDEVELLVEDAERLPGDGGCCEKCVAI